MQTSKANLSPPSTFSGYLHAKTERFSFFTPEQIFLRKIVVSPGLCFDKADSERKQSSAIFALHLGLWLFAHAED